MDPFFTRHQGQDTQEHAAQWTTGRWFAGVMLALLMVAAIVTLTLIVLDRLPTGMALS